MPTTSTHHYDNFLGPIYSWMVGDFETACGQAEAFYERLGAPIGNGRLAVDLGCGHGVHSVALARRGYTVVSLDLCEHLLDELQSRAVHLPIHAIAADLLDFSSHLPTDQAALIACMGDTLTHLPSISAVESLIREVALHLDDNGLFTLSFRDYATRELTESSRFIPVRSDADRIQTCFLEYLPHSVRVHDILHSRLDNKWHLSVSAYEKLRLDPAHITNCVESVGLHLVHHAVDQGMHYLAFEKAASGPKDSPT